jgi:hypothetical protein
MVFRLRISLEETIQLIESTIYAFSIPYYEQGPASLLPVFRESGCSGRQEASKVLSWMPA